MRPKIRFEVFKRDGFSCAYCGRKPPMVILELDHVIAKKNGGKDDIDNLITACKECNRGKGARPLTSVPTTIQQRTEEMKEREAQLRAYERALKTERRRRDKEIDKLNVTLSHNTQHTFNKHFAEHTLRPFLESLSFEDVNWALSRALMKTKNNPNQAVKYFCGICWKWIKSGEVTRG